MIMGTYRISSEVADIITRDVLKEHISFMKEDMVKYESMMDAGEALQTHEAENYSDARKHYSSLSAALEYFGG